MTQKLAVYPGTFDPVTYGHIDIIKRASEVFDHVFVAVAKNMRKKPMFNASERVTQVREALKEFDNLTVETFDGLVVDYAKLKSANVMVRGLRATSDFDYEFQMALMNRNLDESIQTIFLVPSQKYFYLSSSLIKEIAWLGGDISDFVPLAVEDSLKQRIKEL